MIIPCFVISMNHSQITMEEKVTMKVVLILWNRLWQLVSDQPGPILIEQRVSILSWLKSNLNVGKKQMQQKIITKLNLIWKGWARKIRNILSCWWK